MQRRALLIDVQAKISLTSKPTYLPTVSHELSVWRHQQHNQPGDYAGFLITWRDDANAGPDQPAGPHY